jgi:hypothetical protein
MEHRIDNLSRIVRTKYQKDNLILGDVKKVTNNYTIIPLRNNECLINGEEHDDMQQSMYVEVVDKFLTIKCRHPDCFARTYPREHLIIKEYDTDNININNLLLSMFDKKKYHI